ASRRPPPGRRGGVMWAAAPPPRPPGGAGGSGPMRRRGRPRPGRPLPLLDIAGPPAGPAEEVVRASITDMDAMTAASRGASAVIHLASIATEAPWPEILQLNIHGTYVAFEAARRAGVPGGSSPRPTPRSGSRRGRATRCPITRFRHRTPTTAWPR